MSRYSDQFKRDAVALYENNEDLSLKSASAELGINQASRHSWGKNYGTGTRSPTKALHDKAHATTESVRIRELEKEVSKLRENRDILHKAAKYFADKNYWSSASGLFMATEPSTQLTRMCHMLQLNHASFYK